MTCAHRLTRAGVLVALASALLPAGCRPPPGPPSREPAEPVTLLAEAVWDGPDMRHEGAGFLVLSESGRLYGIMVRPAPPAGANKLIEVRFFTVLARREVVSFTECLPVADPSAPAGRLLVMPARGDATDVRALRLDERPAPDMGEPVVVFVPDTGAPGGSRAQAALAVDVGESGVRLLMDRDVEALAPGLPVVSRRTGKVVGVVVAGGAAEARLVAVGDLVERLGAPQAVRQLREVVTAAAAGGSGG